MRWSMLLGLLMLPATTVAQERMRAGEFRAMPPQQIADALLPAGHVPIASVTFDRMGEPRPPAPFVATIRTVRFFGIPAPIGADFCVQEEIIGEITPMPEPDDAWLEAPPRLLRVTPGRRLYRYRPPDAACEGAYYPFSVVGMPDTEGLDAYRALVAAAALAKRTTSRLPFRVECVGLVTCRGARDAMRNLPIDMIEDVRRADRPNLDGRKLVSFRLPLSGTMSTTIAVTFRRGRIEHIEHGVGMVVF